MNNIQDVLQELEVRPVILSSKEYTQLLALRQEVLRKPLGLDYSPEDLASERDDLHFAVFNNDQVVGCFLIRAVKTDTWKLRQFAVSPTLQGKGIGQWMLSEMEKIARQHGVNHISMHARETAVPFYEAQGYQRVGKPFTEVTIPHWRMEKTL